MTAVLYRESSICLLWKETFVLRCQRYGSSSNNVVVSSFRLRKYDNSQFLMDDEWCDASYVTTFLSLTSYEFVRDFQNTIPKRREIIISQSTITKSDSDYFHRLQLDWIKNMEFSQFIYVYISLKKNIYILINFRNWLCYSGTNLVCEFACTTHSIIWFQFCLNECTCLVSQIG